MLRMKYFTATRKMSILCFWRRRDGPWRGEILSGSPAKSGPLDFGTKNNFPSFFVSEKYLVHIYIKAIYYFPVLYFCFATSQNSILAEPRLPTVIRKVKFTDFVKRATSPKMQLTEFRFHMNSKVHSVL